eukprot:CAMPEP_0174729812 /NCGR_PEP_ID=MMETSP1094-20130205/54390_1 /TAXON_ID=156173 /ORGANISM="Chrysochromulina brevifilum, Strain UTEX LB 985" /LENGTH=70 /DNA_ID=CAMNT_0015931973 /DNA_START=122 /DNA_END=330 /DNA_ORIENTATION=-
MTCGGWSHTCRRAGINVFLVTGWRSDETPEPASPGERAPVDPKALRSNLLRHEERLGRQDGVPEPAAGGG